MTREQIPDELKRFILASISSVPFLEAMLLLRNEAAHAWDAKRLARRLYIGERAATQLLGDLHAGGLIQISDRKLPSYRYGPAAETMQTMVDQLAAAYAVHLVEITNLIHSGSAKKAQRFSDTLQPGKDS